MLVVDDDENIRLLIASALRFAGFVIDACDDGHTASLFPGKPAVQEKKAWLAASPPGVLPPPVDRVTFTFPVLNAAREALLSTGTRPLMHRMRRDSKTIPGVIMADIWMRLRERLRAE